VHLKQHYYAHPETNKTAYHCLRLYFSCRKDVLAERISVRWFFRNDGFQERTDNKYKSKICVDAP
jgi:hypothetical protein